MEVEGQQEQERPESRQDKVSELDNESVAESKDGGGPPGTSAGPPTKNVVKFKLLSPMGGRSLELSMVKGEANSVAQEELHLHLTNIFRLGLGIREAFEKGQEATWQNLPWSDVEKCQKMVHKLNKCIASVVTLWAGFALPHSDRDWFQSPFCTAEQCEKLSLVIFNRVVKNPRVLNKCYKSFSSLTYGETSCDQIQVILDRIKMTEKDVFVDLGSGVGHVVTYASAYTTAKKCVGIEINDVPAQMATKMKKEFENMMSWYGKKYRPFDLVHGDFLDEKYKELITSEATVIYINNFAFDSHLMFSIRELIKDMAQGTRIICTKSLKEEREDMKEQTRRPLSGRTIQRQTLDMILDVEELPIADAPVSWSTGKGVPFLLFTVNQAKMAHIYESLPKSVGGSAESGVIPADESQSRRSRGPSLASSDVLAAMHNAIKQMTNPMDRRRNKSPPTKKRREEEGKENRGRSGKGRTERADGSSKGRTERADGSSKGRTERADGSREMERKEKEAREEAEKRKKYPFGKPAALGHSDDYDKAVAPSWAAKEGDKFVAVYAPHHSIFEHPEPLPAKRQRKTVLPNLKLK